MNGFHEVCTFLIDGHLFGIDVVEVQEVIRPQQMTRVPLAPRAVAGLLNVRGQLVTAIDLRRRLDLPARQAGMELMNIVVGTPEGAVSLLVDSVGEVLSIADDAYELPPPTLRPPARDVVRGVVKLSGRLLLHLDTKALIGGVAATI